ncbi:hypothetical protein V6N13_072169 [Hibiscus sabdariffa]
MIGEVVKVDTLRIDLNMIDYLQPNSKLQYGDWLRYIPTKKQEPQPRSKGSFRYLAGVNNTKPKNAAIETSLSNPRRTTTDPLLQSVAAAETTTGSVLPVNAIDQIGPNLAKDTTMDAVTDPNVTTIKANDTKLATATASVVSNLFTTNVELVAEMFPTKEASITGAVEALNLAGMPSFLFP